MYKVDKDIPLPPDIRHEGKYPFPDMEVGHSFAAPKAQAATIRSAAAYHRRRYHKRFAIRPDKDQPDHIRVWRVE
jgi:hypothetical protein